MKRIWMVLFVLVVFLTMASCAGFTKGGEKIWRCRGTVDTYQPGSMIKLAYRLEIEGFSDEGEAVIMKPTNEADYTFAITPATDVKVTITPGVRVLVRYTQAGGEQTAVSIEKVWGK